MNTEKIFDFVVIGSGVAGLTYALKVASFGSVALLTKKNATESNTYYAQGGIACVTSPEDSFDLHVEDTLAAGGGLCDENAVRTIISEGPARIEELMALGVHFSQRKNRALVESADDDGVLRDPASASSECDLLNGRSVGSDREKAHQMPLYKRSHGEEYELDLGKEGGHSKRRVLHIGDTTGKEIENALFHAISQHPNISLFEHHYAIDLITSSKMGLATQNRCLGIYALNHITGIVETFRASVVVLATGGCGKCYLYTTNPSVATGDGVAMAYRAGLPIANMEFIQFHPTCLFDPHNPSFLISEALRGEGGVLINEAGEDFTRKYHASGSLAPRDTVARAIDAEMKASGARHVLLDITSKPRAFLQKRFPTIYKACAHVGIDIATEPIPVVPAAHYQCGGVVTDLDGATALPGLLAIGEVACTGLHGANRLASNSLLEGAVMAHRAALKAPEQLQELRHTIPLKSWQDNNAQDSDELVVITHNWREIRQLMWDYVGIVRTTKRLQRAQARLQLLMDEIHDYYWNFKIRGDLIELRNLALVAHLIVQSALERKESRGLHFTTDYPQTSSQKENTIIRL